MKVRVLLVAEFDVGDVPNPVRDALVRLDAFREAVQPAAEYGVTLYRPDEPSPAMPTKGYETQA